MRGSFRPRVFVQQPLCAYPLFSFYQSFMAAYGKHPLHRRPPVACFLPGLAFVVGQKPPFSIRVLFRAVHTKALLRKISQSLFIRPAIHGVLQHAFYPCPRIKNAVFLQTPLRPTDRPRGQQRFIRLPHHLPLFGHGAQHIPAFFAVPGSACNLLAAIAQRRRPAQPLPVAGKQLHIVLHTLGYGFAFQLRKYRGNIQHGFAHRRCRIKLLAEADKIHPVFVQLFNQGRKIRYAAAHPVQPIADQRVQFPLPYIRQQRQKLGALYIRPGKPLVFIHRNFGIRPVRCNVCPAKLFLIFHGISRLAFYGFSAVNAYPHHVHPPAMHMLYKSV